MSLGLLPIVSDLQVIKMAYILYSKFMLTTETDLTCEENVVAEYDHVNMNLHSIYEKNPNVSFLKFSS